MYIYIFIYGLCTYNIEIRKYLINFFSSWNKGHTESDCLKTHIGDICEPENIENIFKDVNTVFHCAALVTIEYPPNFEELNRINIMGKCIYTIRIYVFLNF